MSHNDSHACESGLSWVESRILWISGSNETTLKLKVSNWTRMGIWNLFEIFYTPNYNRQLIRKKLLNELSERKASKREFRKVRKSQCLTADQNICEISASFAPVFAGWNLCSALWSSASVIRAFDDTVWSLCESFSKNQAVCLRFLSEPLEDRGRGS